jgi:hypothetical protein
MGEDGYNLIPDLPGLPSTMDGSASFPPKGRGGLVEDLDDKLVNGDSSARGLNPHMPSWVNEEHWKTMHGWQKQRIILEDFVKKAKSAADKLCEDKVHCCCKSVGIHLIFLKQSAISRSGFTKSMADRRGNWVNLHFSKLSGDHLIWNVPCK